MYFEKKSLSTYSVIDIRLYKPQIIFGIILMIGGVWGAVAITLSFLNQSAKYPFEPIFYILYLTIFSIIFILGFKFFFKHMKKRAMES